MVELKGKIDIEINERLRTTRKTFDSFKTTFLRRKEISRSILTEVLKKVSRPTITYSSETCTLTEDI